MEQLFAANTDWPHGGDRLVFETEADVYDTYPWASIVVACDGGWQVFESMSDYDTWQDQT
jgi:hypothetical protein